MEDGRTDSIPEAPARFVLASLWFAGVLFAMTPVAGPFLSNRLSIVATGLYTGESGRVPPLPWLDPPIAVLQTTALALAISSTAVLLVNVSNVVRRRRPRWIPALGVILSIASVLVWTVAWRQTFSIFELLKDFGIKSP